MSISFSVVLLLFVCLHACNARTFGIVRDDSAVESQLSVAKVNDEKVNPDRKNPVAGTQNGSSSRVPEKVTVSGFRKSDRKKRGQAESGFTLDYLPPRTRPPVHN